MKGDNIPKNSILSPLSNSMGDDYTDSWFDFLLDPLKLKAHLEDLKNGKSNHPNVSSIIKTLLKQFEKYQQQQIEQQQQQQQGQGQTQQPLSSSTGISSINPTTKRSKLIIDLVIDVCANLKFSLDDFEKNIPIKHQRVILEQLEQSEVCSNVDIEYQTFLNRWIIRGIIKGTPIKYLLSNYSSSSSSPNLTSTSFIPSSLPPSSPMTPPSSPPPTPPSFLSLSSSSNNKNELNSSGSNSDIQQQLEELFHKSNLFLNEWINENYDDSKPSDSDQVVPIVLCELGEFQFYKENFYDARQLFDKAFKIINTKHISEIIEKILSSSSSSSTTNNKTKSKLNITGNKLQQLIEYKEKINSLIIACKTIDMYDDSSMKQDRNINEENYENINFKVERAISKKDLIQLTSLLNEDITNNNSDKESISLSFRFNLETNILPKIIQSLNLQDKSSLLNIHYGNLIKSVLLSSNNIPSSTFYNYQYDLNQFKSIGEQEINIFFTLIKMVFEKIKDRKEDCEKINYLLFKIYNIIINDYSNSNNENNHRIILFYSQLKQKLKQQGIVFQQNHEIPEVEEEEKIQKQSDYNISGFNNIIEFNNLNNNQLILNNFIKENEPLKIKQLIEPIKQQFNLNEQQLNAIYYQKSLDLFECGDIENSKSILLNYITAKSNSTEYQLYLYDLLLKNYKKDQQQQQQQDKNNKKQIKSRTIIIDSFKSLLSKYGIPSEYILERILSNLLNNSKWETVKSLCNLLKSHDSLIELVNIANSIASIGKIVEIENKEKKQEDDKIKLEQQQQQKEKEQKEQQKEQQTDNNDKMDTDTTDLKTTTDNNNPDNSNNINDQNKNNKTPPLSSSINNNINGNGFNSDNDSDMDIDDDDDLTPTYTNSTTQQSNNQLNKNQSNNSKATINSKSEESIVSFINSIIPKYEQKSIHWTFIESNEFYSKNSNQISGLLNLLEKKSLYNRVILIFVGLIHSIQVCRKTQNDINLSLYNEYSNQIANTIVFPNKHFSVEIESILLNVYLDTLNRMNKIFGLNLEKNQLVNIDQNSSNIAEDLSNIEQQQQIFNNGKNLIYIGDIYFEKKYYRESLRYYLLGCAIENAFYSDPKKTTITTTKYFTHLARRLFDCFYFLRSPMQAIVVSQFFGNLNQTCSISFKIIQDEFYQLDSNYFQYIWEIPLLEILINTFSKQKDIKKVYILNQIISNPNINEFNHPDIRKNFIKNTKNNFWKAISSNYLLS